MAAEAAPSLGTGAGTGVSGTSALTRNHIFRYVAAAFGLVALVSFYLPWVDATLNGVGKTQLTGLELARGESQARVDRALFGPGSGRTGPMGVNAGGGSTSAGTAAGSTIGGSSAGLVLPTRQPTVASGAQGSSLSLGGATPVPSGTAAPAPAAPPAAVAAAPASGVAAGGLVLPTRQPTVAAGSQGSGLSLGGTAITTGASGSLAATAAASPLPPPPKEPDSLPQFILFAVPLAALGLAVFPIIWERLSDTRDRRYGRLWTLVLSFGGALWVGSLVLQIITAPPENSLVGAGVGSVSSVAFGMWGAFLGFLLSAICLTVAWLSPPPAAPDPYWRARMKA